MKKLTYKLAGLMMALAIIFSALDISIAQYGEEHSGKYDYRA